VLTLRDEVIMKDRNTCRIHLRREQNAFKEMVEQLKMSKIINGFENFENNEDLLTATKKFVEENGGSELSADILQSELDLN